MQWYVPNIFNHLYMVLCETVWYNLSETGTDYQQDKSDGFDSCDRPSNLTKKLDSNRRFFDPCDLEIWWMTSKINRASLLCYFKRSAPFQSHRRIHTGVTVRKSSNQVKVRITLKNNRVPLVCYCKPDTSFQSHWWIQTGVTVRKRSIWFKICNFLSRVTLKFDGWPWKTIEHPFYSSSTFVHHVKAIGEFEMELQSGSAIFGSKSAIFCPVWPWNLTDDLEKQ